MVTSHVSRTGAAGLLRGGLSRGWGLSVFLGLLLGVPPDATQGLVALDANPFIRGDVNYDGVVSQADVSSIIRSFQTNHASPCNSAADFDDSGAIEISDLINLVGFIYFRGRAPARPYPHPGFDGTPDDLPCDAAILHSLFPKGDPVKPDAPSPEPKDDIDEGQVIDFIEFLAYRIEAYPGEMGIRVPVLLSSPVPVDGFTIAAVADPRTIWLEDIEIPRQLSSTVKPEFSPKFTSLQRDGYLARSVFLDYSAPFEERSLPRPSKQLVAELVFGVIPSVLPGAVLSVRLGDSPFPADDRTAPFNEICFSGHSVRPKVGPTLEVVVHAEQTLFVRGDTDLDRLHNITDVVKVLRYLFLDDVLMCRDSADADDSGSVDISDAIRLADFLYGSGNPPPYPFPNPGRDRSVDALGDCQ